MSTLPPRRSRIFRVSAWKRGTGRITASGMSGEFVQELSSSLGMGSQKSSTPIMGKAGIVTIASLGSTIAANRFRRRIMDASTRRRSAVKPPYGRRGVPSIIHAPYSGCQAAPSPYPSRRP
eukprot:scaffold204954_cov27-Tisochrysis_lutea.AAC.2